MHGNVYFRKNNGSVQFPFLIQVDLVNIGLYKSRKSNRNLILNQRMDKTFIYHILQLSKLVCFYELLTILLKEEWMSHSLIQRHPS